MWLISLVGVVAHDLDLRTKNGALVATGEVNEAGGYAATKALMYLREAPTAVIYNNDAMALGGCRALTDLGLKVGREVAVIVVASTAFSSYLCPALTGFSTKLEPVGPPPRRNAA